MLGALMPLITIVGGFFILGIILIIGGMLFGSKDAVTEGSKQVGIGCLWIFGLIGIAFLIISMLSGA